MTSPEEPTRPEEPTAAEEEPTVPEEQTAAEEPTGPDELAADGPRLGEVERVPLKVVPIYVHPIEDEPPVEQAEDADEVLDEEPAPKRRTAAYAFSAVVLALGTVAVHIAALVVATEGDFPAGTLLGYIAVGLSVLAVLTGIVAVIRRRAWVWALIATVVAVLANPVVLLAVLRFLSGLQTT